MRRLEFNHPVAKFTVGEQVQKASKKYPKWYFNVAERKSNKLKPFLLGVLFVLVVFLLRWFL